ncbi:N-acetyltransferase [uncultured Veillonella sp.]|uniref:GNAT family N-acetyltransferase n=1 Tax=uncultured Veillonella sp. TaxID=159268 RepID=UPI00262DA707|nr:N-acetyltransferase [uncultured Veillonella sp.]
MVKKEYKNQNAAVASGESKPTISTRPITVADVAILRPLAVQTFRETFGHHNTEEELQDYFNTAYAVETLEKEIADPEAKHYFIFVNDELAGYLKVNVGAAQTEQELDNAFEVQRIYILRAFQGLGLGRYLFEFALREACNTTCDWVWLGVWEHNIKAQRFYSHYGFERFSEHRFDVGGKVDCDFLLKCSVNKIRELLA